jgi:hypothetical protein
MTKLSPDANVKLLSCVSAKKQTASGWLCLIFKPLNDPVQLHKQIIMNVSVKEFEIILMY